MHLNLLTMAEINASKMTAVSSLFMARLFFYYARRGYLSAFAPMPFPKNSYRRNSSTGNYFRAFEDIYNRIAPTRAWCKRRRHAPFLIKM